MNSQSKATDRFGRVWFSIPRGDDAPHLAMGMEFAVPVDDGKDWSTLGTISAGVVRDDVIWFALSPSSGTRFLDPPSGDPVLDAGES